MRAAVEHVNAHGGVLSEAITLSATAGLSWTPDVCRYVSVVLANAGVLPTGAVSRLLTKSEYAGPLATVLAAGWSTVNLAIRLPTAKEVTFTNEAGSCNIDATSSPTSASMAPFAAVART